MRVLVVDDEAVARRRLVRMLGRVGGVEVAGEAADGIEARDAIACLRPDVVLLDVRLPGLDGLALASSTPDLPPIIFTTAYDEYAVQAFEVAAVDYLLKPVRRERLEAALGRARARRGSGDTAHVGGAGGVGDAERIRDLLERLARRAAADDPAPVSARAGSTVRIFDPRTITRFSASEKYTLFRKGGAEYVLDESLASLERRLCDAGFLRVHRGELVNLKQVKAIGVEDGATYVDLADGQRVPVSRRFVAALKERLGMRGA